MHIHCSRKAEPVRPSRALMLSDLATETRFFLCFATAFNRCHVVQRERATLRVQRDHATSRRAEGPRDATRCRETAPAEIEFGAFYP